MSRTTRGPRSINPVYTWTVAAPASRQASASAAEKTPPHALMGSAPPVAARTSPTIRTVSGNSPRPESPPAPTDRRRSDTGRVLEQVRPSAPPSWAMRASASTASRSTSLRKGGSFTNSGLVRRAPSSRMSRAMWASLSRSRPQETLGQLALSSTPSTWGSSRAWVATTSPGPWSAMLANRGPDRGDRDRVRAAASAPGLGRPTAFVIDPRPGYRAIRGFAFPERGSRVIVPPITYPNPRRPRASRCRQDLSKPAARPTGFDSSIPASEVRSAGSFGVPPIRSHGRGSERMDCANRWAASGGSE